MCLLFCALASSIVSVLDCIHQPNTATIEQCTIQCTPIKPLLHSTPLHCYKSIMFKAILPTVPLYEVNSLILQERIQSCK